jgi:RNA polymerase sigma-70 factor (ECF subfamily)
MNAAWVSTGGSDDPALVRAARTEPDAFGALYDRYFPRVYGYLRGYTQSDEDAADLAQQVFLRALGGLPRYSERKGPFGAWLFAIARNAATDAHRRRRAAVSLRFVPELAEPAAHGPEAVALRHEALARLRTLLLELDPEQRELIWLRFVGELGVEEIAGVVGKSPGAVRKQLSRTLQRLGERYDEG